MMFCGYASAKIYYIDFSTGTDKATGLLKTTPWKLHPFMNGFAGAYTHAAGDTFYFKGGVTWPASCFCMSISASGSALHPDYYGANISWFTGTSFTRPIFDAQQAVLYQAQKIIDISNDNYVIVDKLEIKGLLVNNNNSFMLGSISSYNSENIIIKNCYIHDWSISKAVTQDGMFGGIVFNNPMDNTPGRGDIIDSCEISDSAMGGNCGFGVRNVETVSHSVIHHVPNGAVGSIRIFTKNIVHDTHGSFDPTEHTNGVETFLWNNAAGPSNISNNLFYNNDMMPLFVSPSSVLGGPNCIVYIYNNVLYNSPRGIEIDPQAVSTTTPQGKLWAYIFNNTIVGSQIRVTPRSGVPPLKKMVLVNNHFIIDLPTGTKTAAIYNTPSNGGAVDTAVDSNNLIMSTSVANQTGYTLNNRYAPISNTSSTVDKGIVETSFFKTDWRDTLRPKGKTWDIGAFEFVPSADNPVIDPESGRRIDQGKKSGPIIINRAFSNEQKQCGIFTVLGARCFNPSPASNVYFLKNETDGSIVKTIVNR